MNINLSTEEELLKEYEMKLTKYGDLKTPDPFILISGWLTKNYLAQIYVTIVTQKLLSI